MTLNKTKTAAIYIRVSTEAQREEGYSIDAQKEMLTAHCVSKGIKNYAYYIDGGFTGSNIERPQMQLLISDIKQGKISHVVVYKLDRLSRSQKDTLYLIEDVFNPHGVDFISMNESMDTSTPLGRLMLGILSAFAQLERENIRERTRMGMRERVKSGKWMGGGRTPFGYDYDEITGTLVPNKDAERVRKVYELYLKGHSTGHIAQSLGLKYDKLAYQILTRKSNAGYIQYNGEEYLGKHEPIISLETYEGTMRYMKERSVKKVSESNYLLTGLLVCGRCGAKMRYQKWGKRDCKLVCYSQDKSKKHLVKDENCNNPKIWATDVEDLVVKDFLELSFEYSKLAPPKISNMSLLEVLHDQYSSIAQKLRRLYNLYAESTDDILLESINTTKKELYNIQLQIENETEKNKSTGGFANLHKTLTELPETWEYMTIKEKKVLLNDCINKITITDGHVVIDYKLSRIKEDGNDDNK
ncbi:MAG: recombinase family protein [Defluviitaleaceae bacterium]|nr:recombinase family protein [Defluviitaleaceae bacterium]